jgi:nitrogen fixation NifU-like protein
MDGYSVVTQDLAKFYRDTILKHSVEPVGYRLEINASHQNEQYNPLCGDRVLVKLRVKDGQIEATAFDGEACAICMASASLLCEELVGQDCAVVSSTYDWLEQTLKQPDTVSEKGPERLQALMGVRRYPSRVKCVLLPWTAALKALK